LFGDGWIFCFGFGNTKLYEEREMRVAEFHAYRRIHDGPFGFPLHFSYQRSSHAMLKYLNTLLKNTGTN